MNGRRAISCFVWSPAGYTLRELRGRPAAARRTSSRTATATLVVNKIGASPLPGDSRACAFSVGKYLSVDTVSGCSVLGRDEAEHERLREAARVAARRDPAGVDARGPQPVDRRSVLAQHARPLVDRAGRRSCA